MQEKEMLVFTLPLHYTWATSHIDLYIHTEKKESRATFNIYPPFFLFLHKQRATSIA